METPLPYHRGDLPIRRKRLGFDYSLKFVIKNGDFDIRRYIGLRDKLSKIKYYIVDTDTGSRKRKTYNYMYIWVMDTYDKKYTSSLARHGWINSNYEDLINNLEYLYKDFIFEP